MKTGCPKCDMTTLVGTKDLCPEHKLEYLYYEYDTTRKALMAEMKKQKDKLIANIKNLNQKGTKNEKL